MFNFRAFFKLYYVNSVPKIASHAKYIKQIIKNNRFLFVTIAGLVVYRKFSLQPFPQNVIYAKEAKKSEDKDEQVRVTSHRELRFQNFASIEYNGNAFMTPRDFLESIIYDSPRSRNTRKHLHQADVEKYVKKTPAKKKSTKRMFRQINEEGLISFTEYLFLLCVLTKPRSGFQIAFSMFDTDGDQKVDKTEFMIMQCSLFGSHDGAFLLGTDEVEDATRHSQVRKNIWQLLHEKEAFEREDGQHVETTLLTHFFGNKGKDVLNFQDFSRFMENLQTEVLELEFAEFSHSMATITETDFAKILLRYTQLTEEEQEIYMARLSDRIKNFQGVNFEDFKEFCQFLNSIDDFSLAMRIYTYADHPISEVDFNRAVKACTGQNLNAHVVHVVFQLFDADGDGRLSYKEFISVMKERLHRGTKVVHAGAWDSFKHCVQNEVRNA